VSQFRNTADIKIEVLDKAGEPVNGNSAYESLVMTYINKAHQAIVGGGSIFSLKVDEAWTWAKHRYPIILELQPAYATGSVTVTNNGRSVIFSHIPPQSFYGWYLKLDGDRTVYKITEHLAMSLTGSIDSGFLGATGTYNFRLFKLDYEISPTYITIDSKNDKLDLVRTGSTQIALTLTHGSYRPAELVTHVVALLNAQAVTEVYSGSYDSVFRLFTFTSNLAGGAVFKLLGATGTNRKRSALPTLGFDNLDLTGAAQYISTYVVGGISRLIEPFKIYKQNNDNPYIHSVDLVQMECDYPMWSVREKVPELFAKVEEGNDGTVTVRFNSYPPEAMRCEINWIPVPIDLQDNDVSIPLIPRKDIDCLIHGAAAFILFDKEDTKFKDILSLAETALLAMEKKNRSEMRRTDDQYGQIIPRLDLAVERRRLVYGYENNGSQRLQPTPPPATIPTMTKATLTYQDFGDPALSQAVVAHTITSEKTLIALLIKHSIAFSGGSISALKLSVGIAGDPTKFINQFDVFQAVDPAAQDGAVLMYFPAVNTDVIVTAEATGGNLNTMVAGSVDIYFQELAVL